MPEGAVLGIDPGTVKCGVALLEPAGEVSWRQVVATENLGEKLAELGRAHALGTIALGNRTGAGAVRDIVAAALPGVPLQLVPEHRTTEQARELYWHYHPPRGWRRLIPRGLLLPPEPVDAYAAEILARRLL